MYPIESFIIKNLMLCGFLVDEIALEPLNHTKHHRVQLVKQSCELVISQIIFFGTLALRGPFEFVVIVITIELVVV